MYSLHDYGSMIADAARLEAYAEAIAHAVRPGDAVLDLGCGPGILAMLACQAGAARVYAIELDPRLETAQQLAAANGFADRIVFFAGDSRKIELPERVRVMVSDVRGVLPFFGAAIPSLEDARQRFLAPQGIAIPQRDTLFAAIIEARELFEKITHPWNAGVRGLNLSAGREPVLHSTHAIDCKAQQLLSEPMEWGVLDYAAGARPSTRASLPFRITRQGTAHGLCLWFDAQLWREFGYSSGPLVAPERRAKIYGQIFLPWLEPVPLAEGQAVPVELHADFVGEDYIWRWNTTLPQEGGRSPRRFEQSTFWGAAWTKDMLRRRAADFVPELTDTGEADRWILDAIDGRQTLEEIARAGAARYPKQFQSFEKALWRVTSLAAQYAR